MHFQRLGKASVIPITHPSPYPLLQSLSLTVFSICLEILNITISSNSITTTYRQHVDSSKVRRSIVHCHLLRHCPPSRCTLLHLLPDLQPTPRTMHLASLRALDAALPFLPLSSVVFHGIVPDDYGHGSANTREFSGMLSVGGTEDTMVSKCILLEAKGDIH